MNSPLCAIFFAKFLRKFQVATQYAKKKNGTFFKRKRGLGQGSSTFIGTYHKNLSRHPGWFSLSSGGFGWFKILYLPPIYE